MQNYLDPAIRYIDSWLETQTFLDHQTPGYSVAIALDGEIKYKRGFGYANTAQKEVMTPEHIFRVASHSKTFTATAIMQLAEAGHLDLNDKVSQHLAFLKENADENMGRISIEELLQHASGLARDGEDPSFWRLKRPFPDKGELIAFFKDKPLVTQSGVRFKYSNYAYALLGFVIEEVSGKTFAEYMREKILESLHLSRISPEYDPSLQPYITGYTGIAPNGEQVPLPENITTGDMIAATGFCSDAESLCRFYSALLPQSGLLLSEESKRKIFVQCYQVSDEDNQRGYGLGFQAEKIGERLLNGHSGGMPGNTTKTCFDCQDKIVVSVLSNSHAGRPEELQKGIWSILDTFKRSYDSQSPYLRYEGKFYDVWGTSHYVPMGDKIYVSSPDAAEPFKDCSELEHLEADRFKIIKEQGYGSYGETVEFFMEDGRPRRVTHGGYEKLNLEDYLVFIEELKKENPLP